MPRVTLDTNEYISALNFGGAPMRLLHMAVDGDIELFISEPIIVETLRVLRDKFGWQGYDVFDAGQRLRKVGKVVTPRQTLNVVEDDPPDNRILECAVESQSEFIVTEDYHLRASRSCGCPNSSISAWTGSAPASTGPVERVGKLRCNLHRFG